MSGYESEVMSDQTISVDVNSPTQISYPFDSFTSTYELTVSGDVFCPLASGKVIFDLYFNDTKIRQSQEIQSFPEGTSPIGLCTWPLQCPKDPNDSSVVFSNTVKLVFLYIPSGSDGVSATIKNLDVRVMAVA